MTRSPRLFGRPLWAWAALLTTRFTAEGELPWSCRLSRATLWPLCQHLTGHVQAPGETGYGGGGMLDVFCAYCYYPWQVPLSEAPSTHFLAELFHGPPPA